MIKELNVIDNAAEVKDLIVYLKDKEYVAYDIESTGVTKESEIIGYSICVEEHKAFYVVLAKWDVILVK